MNIDAPSESNHPAVPARTVAHAAVRSSVSDDVYDAAGDATDATAQSNIRWVCIASLDSGVCRACTFVHFQTRKSSINPKWLRLFKNTIYVGSNI